MCYGSINILHTIKTQESQDNIQNTRFVESYYIGIVQMPSTQMIVFNLPK